MTAIYHNTPSEPLGPWVMPGQYVVRLTVGDKSFDQPLTVKMDPRVKTPLQGLTSQFELSMQCYEGAKQARATLSQLRSLRTQIEDLLQKTKDAALTADLTKLDEKTAAMQGSPRRRGPRAAASSREPTLAQVADEMQGLLGVLQRADVAPTSQVTTACQERQKTLNDLVGRWKELSDKEVKALNERLTKANLPGLKP